MKFKIGDKVTHHHPEISGTIVDINNHKEPIYLVQERDWWLSWIPESELSLYDHEKREPKFSLGDRVTYSDSSLGLGIGTVKGVTTYLGEESFRYDVRFDNRHKDLDPHKKPELGNGHWMIGVEEEKLVICNGRWMALEELYQSIVHYGLSHENRLMEYRDQKDEIKECLLCTSVMSPNEAVLTSMDSNRGWILYISPMSRKFSVGNVPFMFYVRYKI